MLNVTVAAKNFFFASQIVQMFPDYSISAVIDDLRSTSSMDVTIENILDGRLLPTLPSFQQEQFNSSQGPSEPFSHVEFPTLQERVFVEDPKERQQQLSSRKKKLLEETRNRFLQRHDAPLTNPNTN